MGLILIVVVPAGNIQDRDGARLVRERLGQGLGRLRLIWADGGYAGQLVEGVKTVYHGTLEIVKRSDDVTGLVVLPENSEAMILIAMINLMSRRLAHGYAKQNF